MAKAKIDTVRRRAACRCEYCRIPDAYYRTGFHVDHIIAKQHGGDDDLENLAWSCLHCNVHKGPNIAGRDPQTRQTTRLFHRRTDRWQDHFRWEGAKRIGTTAIGRTTVTVLAINAPLFRKAREALAAEGVIDLL